LVLCLEFTRVGLFDLEDILQLGYQLLKIRAFAELFLSACEM
jgi:hypothetical protein